MTFSKALLNLMAPVIVLAGVCLLLPAISQLPASLAGLKIYGGWGMLALGTLLGLAFRRGRVVFALLTLALAYAVYALFLQGGLATAFARTVFVALCVFVPVNLTALCLLPERGTFNTHGLQRLGVLAAEVIFSVWIVVEFKAEITTWAYAPFYDISYFEGTPIPQLGLVTIALGFMATLIAGFIRGTPIELGFAIAIAAFGIAADGVEAPYTYTYSLFIAAGALIFSVAVLQDTFRMAFRDELTGLPSRRELNERMMALGRRYTIAMLDVDNFKNFNDTYGHDLGDQILKMVALKLDDVGGGGRAYRYGGEEFTVLFPGKDLAHAMPYLEALRHTIADYKLALRAADRPVKSGKAARHPGTFHRADSVSVTISIGAADCSDKSVTPDDVMKTADRALYRAKDKGRNQVSR